MLILLQALDTGSTTNFDKIKVSLNNQIRTDFGLKIVVDPVF